MPTLNLLRTHRQVIPAWLANWDENTPLNAELFDALLQSRVVFYPGSDCRDRLAFESLTHSHAAHCVIHADVCTDLDDVIKAMPGIRGYRPEVLQRLTQEEARGVVQLNEQRVPGLVDTSPMAQEPALGGAVWSILERNAEFGAEHGPSRVAFLHVKCEAAWLFWNLWLHRNPAPPPPFAIIVAPEYGGCIERLFGEKGAVYQLEGGQAKRPDWILYDRSADALNPNWPDYEVAAIDQDPRPQTLLRRLPDDDPRVVAERLRSTDWEAYSLFCIEHNLKQRWFDPT